MTRRRVSIRASLAAIVAQQLSYIETASSIRPLEKEELKVLDIILKATTHLSPSEMDGSQDVGADYKAVSDSDLLKLVNKTKSNRG